MYFTRLFKVIGVIAAIYLLVIGNAFSQNITTPQLSSQWHFIKQNVAIDADFSTWEQVSVPHTWNAVDASNGGGTTDPSNPGYYRGPGWYAQTLNIDNSMANKRVFVRFEAVSLVADVYFNGTHLGQHTGAFGAFCYELTNHINFGGVNTLRVRADNTYRNDVAPLAGDFPVFGGIYRPVELIVKNNTCITPLDYASTGVYLTQKNVSSLSADVDVLTKVDAKTIGENITITTKITDKDGTLVADKSEAVVVSAAQMERTHSFTIANPNLWEGLSNPYMYTVEVTLTSGATVIDSVSQKLGFRYFSIDPVNGFFLNGKKYTVYGVNRHQDTDGKGWALSNSDHDLDISMIKEIGARGVRLAHYPHSTYFYDKCDENGILVWAEIPLVELTTESTAFELNTKQQLTELIRQHYNHPAIFTWSIFNEIKYANTALPLLRSLNTLCKTEDPNRLTSAATHIANADLCNTTDLLAFNAYPGWYNGDATDMGSYLGNYNSLGKNRGVGISEYGAGASIYHHQYDHRTVPTSNWHPEEWQAYVHEETYRTIKNTQYCWGSFVWNMFDFSSAWRSEGDTEGRNDKGLVTYDRQTRKDAFYYYKANWSSEDVVHLTAKRFTKRYEEYTIVKAYSNVGDLELLVNGVSMGVKSPDEVKICRWENISLLPGINTVTVKNSTGTITDTAQWEFLTPPQTTLNATKDTYIQESESTTNYGTATELLTKYHSSDARYHRKTFLEFDLSNVTYTDIARAKLRFYITNNQSRSENRQIEIYNTASGWDEETVTWNNSPALGDLITSWTDTDAGSIGWKEVDLGSYIIDNWSAIKANDALSIRIAQTNDVDRLNYKIASKEYDNGVSAARLIINKAGLMGHWEFGGNAEDSSDQSNDGTVTGAEVWTTKGLNFDGSSTFVTMDIPNIDLHALAIRFYTGTQITSSSTKNTLVRYGVDYNQHVIGFGPMTNYLTDETITIVTADETRTGIKDSIDPGWHDLILNWNGSSYDFYLDGSKKDTIKSTSGHADLITMSAFALGNSAENTNSYGMFSGEIDEVRIYNRALTTEELADPFKPVVTPAIGLDVSQEGSEFSWSVATEIGVKEYQVVNAATGEVVEVVVAGNGSYSVTLPEGVEAKLVVVDNSGYTQTFLPADGNIVKVVYDLKEGWNLIAMPGENADISALKDVTAGGIWAWNGAAYETTETPAACQGIWIYAPKTVQTIVTAEKSDVDISLQSGWNLVGPKENITVPETAHTVYSWNETYQEIADDNAVLIRGIGYWIFTL